MVVSSSEMSYDETGRRVDALTDHQGFERLATILLARRGLDVRPLGGSGDRGRDAVAGLYRAGQGEDLAITISLNAGWAAKIRADLKRIHDAGFHPTSVISVTNRLAAAKSQLTLQRTAKSSYGVDLTTHDRRWLITQMHLRENLDLRGEYLNLAAPRPRFFLDIGEFEELLERREMLASQFEGRTDEINRLKSLLIADRRAVIIEAEGGYGKTRLAFELARSGLSATQWFFVDRGLDFELEFLSETEAGYDATVLIDDAHRRPDLEQLLRALERRQPQPGLVFTVRPGHSASVEALLHELATETVKLQVDPIGRGALDAILQTEPFKIAHEGMRGAIIALSEGNVGIALLAATLAAQGVEPYELSESEIFSQHVELRLWGAGAASRETREVLAVLSAIGAFDLSDEHDVRAATSLLGGDSASLRRQLDELADAGIVVEQPEHRYTTKPDIVREHLLRASYFPDQGRPVLRYLDVWGAFASHRLRSMLVALGEARIETAPAAAEALHTVRGALIGLLDVATDAETLIGVAELARALGAGGAAIAIELVEIIGARLDELDDASADAVGSRLVEALSAAKFGRDQLPTSWRLLLRLATVSCGRQTPQMRDAALKEIREIYSSVPMNYSPTEAYVMAYVQHTVREQTAEWWEETSSEPAARLVAASVVAVAFQLQLERHRTSAASTMTITLLGGFVPPSNETVELLRFGSKLFRETFLELDAPNQLKEFEALDALARVARGYSGLFGAIPSKELQALARTVLTDLERWLATEVDSLPLPVGAVVVSYFRNRTRQGVRVASPKPSAELRTYIDLVEYDDGRRVRASWEEELAETRRRGGKYGRRLLKTQEPIQLLQVWDGWIEQCESLTGRPANHMTINAAFELVAKENSELARTLANQMFESEMTISRFSDWMVDELAGNAVNWPLIETWARSPSGMARRAAARALHRAPDALVRRVGPTLAQDSEASVRNAAWHALTYGQSDPPSGWRLNLALELTETSEAPLDLLDRLLSTLRHRTGSDLRLTATQRERVRRIVLASARVDEIPRQRGVQMALEEAERLGLDLVLPWLRARLEHVRERANGRYIHPLPDELQGLVYPRRATSAGRRELRRFLDEIEKPSTAGLYRLGIDEAITWLGADSAEVTRRVGKWISGSKHQRRLALSFVGSGNWRVFTRRARLVLDARPNDADVRQALIYAREPLGFVGSREPYYRARASDYRRWLRSKDPRLREAGREAVEHYERLADDARDRDRRERDRI